MRKVFRNGRLVLIGGAQERRLVEAWKRDVLPHLKVRGLVESARGSGRSALHEARSIYESAARSVQQAEDYVSELREMASARHASVGGVMLVLAQLGDVPLTADAISPRGLQVLREVQADGPIAFHRDDLLREAASTSHGGLLRGGRKMHEDPRHPFEEIADQQTAIAARDPVRAKNLADMAAARRRQALASNAANESDLGRVAERPLQFKNVAGQYDGSTDYQPTGGLSMVDNDRQGGGRASGVLDDIEPVTDEDRRQAAADLAANDTTEDGEQEFYNAAGNPWTPDDGYPKFDRFHNPITDSAGNLLQPDDEGEDSGSHASPTWASEDEAAGAGGTLPPEQLRRQKKEAALSVLTDIQPDTSGYSVVRD